MEGRRRADRDRERRTAEREGFERGGQRQQKWNAVWRESESTAAVHGVIRSRFLCAEKSGGLGLDHSTLVARWHTSIANVTSQSLAGKSVAHSHCCIQSSILWWHFLPNSVRACGPKWPTPCAPPGMSESSAWAPAGGRARSGSTARSLPAARSPALRGGWRWLP